VLEKLSCQQLAAAAARPGEAAAAAAAALVRPVLLHYAAVGQLFSDWLADAPTAAAAAASEQPKAAASAAGDVDAAQGLRILSEPSLEQYIAALQLLAAAAAQQKQQGLHAFTLCGSAIWVKVRGS
jgi:hypothetical protein